MKVYIDTENIKLKKEKSFQITNTKKKPTKVSMPTNERRKKKKKKTTRPQKFSFGNDHFARRYWRQSNEFQAYKYNTFSSSLRRYQSIFNKI